MQFVKNLLILVMGLCPFQGMCQSGIVKQANPNVNVIPPSPNVASLIAYAEVPVSKYTGVPSISIPILHG